MDVIMKKEKEEGEEKNQNQELHRITINKNAERALCEVLDQVNDGYIGGRVNRTQLSNWIFLKFKNDANDSMIKEIRMEYFDEVAILESILKQAKETGKVPMEFKHLLQKQLISEEMPKKRSKKALTENIINDDNS